MKKIRRTFAPGSEWVYIKIYAGNRTLENILFKEISQIVLKLKKDQLILKWFFIRYADPDYHIRIRFLLKDTKLGFSLISVFNKKLDFLITNNIIHKIQLDTYNRELERYTSALINEAESLFFIDSECVLKIIIKLNVCQLENYRWMIALKLIDGLLSDFSFNLELKQKFITNLSQSFKMEFGFNQHNSKQLNAKYRENKSVVESVMNSHVECDHFVKLCREIKLRSISLKPVVSQIQIKSKGNKIDLENLLSSYVHMMLNRLFASKNRLHELVLYDFLKRYYTSEIAKKKYNQ